MAKATLYLLNAKALRRKDLFRTRKTLNKTKAFFAKLNKLKQVVSFVHSVFVKKEKNSAALRLCV